MKLTHEEKELLCELVFLGNWLVNACRVGSNEVERYENVAKKVMEQYAKILGFEGSYDDVFDFCLGKLVGYIDEYENDCCFSVLAEKLAKAHFPENSKTEDCSENLPMSCDVAYIYEKELKERGVSILSVDIPDFAEKLDTMRKVLLAKR